MTDNITITDINEDDVYVATIKMYSRGSGDEVVTSFEVSHTLEEEYTGIVPASYSAAQEVMLMLQQEAMMYEASDEDSEFMSDPNVSNEDKVRHVLDVSSVQEEAKEATFH